MINYNDIYKTLQYQVDNGELTVAEATLVNDIAFIGGGQFNLISRFHRRRKF